MSLSVLAAVFISNVPEGLSSAAGMKRNGRSARYVFGVWGGIAVASGLAALLGYVAARRTRRPRLVAVITAVAAGAILTMIADTMIPEAFENTHDLDRADHHGRLPDRVRDQLRLSSGVGQGGSAGGRTSGPASTGRARAPGGRGRRGRRRRPRPRRPASRRAAGRRAPRAAGRPTGAGSRGPGRGPRPAARRAARTARR